MTRTMTLRLMVAMIVTLCLVIPSAAVAQQGTPEASPAAGNLPAGVEVVASGLTNPRGFTWGSDGSLFLALAGTGGPDQIIVEGTPLPFFGGQTSSITTVVDGCAVPLIEDLPSGIWTDAGWVWGVMDVVLFEGELYALSGGGSESWGQPESPNGVYRVLADGTWELVADLGAWLQENPPAFIPPDYDPNGSWFDLEAGPDRLWVTEAVGGRVLTVNLAGEIEQVTDLSVGHLVPTGLALAEDGTAYVGFETVVPYADGSSKVVAIAPDGTVTDHWTGLTAVTDIVLGPDGTLYAAEMATNNLDEEPYLRPDSGRVVRQTGPDTLEAVVTDVPYPVYLGFSDDGALYMDYPAFGPDAGIGQGALLRFDLSAGTAISLAGIGTLPSTCASAAPESTPDGASTAPDSASAVTIVDFAYVPTDLEGAVGTIASWTNQDGAPHTVTAEDGTFDSGRLEPAASFSVTFDEPGIYAYQCTFHPGMQGSVVVT